MRGHGGDEGTLEEMRGPGEDGGGDLEEVMGMWS